MKGSRTFDDILDRCRGSNPCEAANENWRLAVVALFGLGTRPRGADVEEGGMPLTRMTGKDIFVVANSQEAW